MANFTMEIREMVNDPLIRGVFTFPYDFYGNEQEKAEFEKLFIQYYYLSEIGFETPERFKLKLQAKLNIIMPYYRQLAMTEWDKVRTVEQMMTSKNLKETTEHKQTVTGENESESQTSSSNNQSDTMNQSSTSSGTSETTSSGTSETTSSGTSETTSRETSKTSSSGTNITTSSGKNTSSSSTNEKQSNLADGVAQASLTEGYLTAVGESSNNSSGEATNNSSAEATNNSSVEATNNSSAEATNKSNNETNNTSSSTISSTDTSDSSSSTQGTAEQNGKTSGSNKQELTETTTFSSVGDIGIQTPAYAINEWRKVLININQMIIDECRDLFMKIY